MPVTKHHYLDRAAPGEVTRQHELLDAKGASGGYRKYDMDLISSACLCCS